MPFPLPFVPNASYKTGGRRFGALREDGVRKHAACDLLAPVGTEIYAVDDGIVTLGPYPFYHGTSAIEIKHTYFVIRYCEIRGVAAGVSAGAHVSQGQVVAYVGRMHVDSMLHFEMYDGSATGPLTRRDRPPFQRREDLVDPTSLLDYLAMFVQASHAMP